MVNKQQQANLELQGLEAQRALAAALRPLHNTLQRGWAGSLQVGRARRQGSAGTGVRRARATAAGQQLRALMCTMRKVRDLLQPGRSQILQPLLHVQPTCRWKWCLQAGVGERRKPQESVLIGNEAHVARPARAHGGPHHPGAPTASPASSLTCRRWAPPGPRVCSLQGRWGTCRR